MKVILRKHTTGEEKVSEEIVIEHGVEIPPTKQYRKDKFIGLLSKMSPGDSVKINIADCKRLYSYGFKEGYKVVVRRLDEENDRAWLLSKPNSKTHRL